MEKQNVRDQQITRASVVGIAANLFLAGFKAAVGLLSNSIPIVPDAVNNLTDALSSVITILGVKPAKRHPETPRSPRRPRSFFDDEKKCINYDGLADFTVRNARG